MAIVRLDKIQAIYSGNIESILPQDHHVGIDRFQNGVPVKLVQLAPDEREVYIVEPVTAVGEEVLIHATPEVSYGPWDIPLANFELRADQVGRAYHFTEGDVFSITLDLVTETADADVGNFLVADINNEWMWESVNAIPANTRFAAEIIEETTLGFDQDDAIAVRVVQVGSTRA